MPTTPDRPDGRSAGSGDPIEAAEATDDAARGKPGRPVPASPEPDDFDIVRETVAAGVRPAAPDHATVRLDPAPSGAGREQDRETVTVDPRQHRTVRVDPGNHPTVTVPGQRRPADARGRAPLPVAAAFATLWAALLSYLPVAVVIGLARSLEGQGGLGSAAHAGLAGWLLGHGVPIGTSIGPLGLAPLLLTLLAGWRLNRAGLHVTRAIGARRSASPRAALLVGATIGAAYAILGLLAALVVDGRGTDVSPARAAVHLFLAGFVCALIGSLRGTDALVVIARRLPPPVRHALRTGVVAALLILAAGAAFAGLSVAVGGGQAADMIGAYRTGVVGQAGITLVSLGYGANGAVWAAAYLLGPGFLLGTDSAVRLTELSVGPLPTLPLLAGLPNGPMGASGAALLAVPVLAAMAAGWLLTRRLMGVHHVVDGHLRDNRRAVRPGEALPAEPAWSLVLGSALLAGPVAGLVLGVLAWLSGGPLGDGRMAEIGPVPWHVALIATTVVGVSSCIGAAAGRAFRAPVHK
ncbi:DUF6350 family protein [Actinoplanes sp. NPDC051346]|uniref:cell division protein PerM n=1 Tax=Actinoplanes sp. NPDC051346 TaxID=3155048 RepID=UPI003420D283